MRSVEAKLSLSRLDQITWSETTPFRSEKKPTSFQSNLLSQEIPGAITRETREPEPELATGTGINQNQHELEPLWTSTSMNWNWKIDEILWFPLKIIENVARKQAKHQLYHQENQNPRNYTDFENKKKNGPAEWETKASQHIF